LERKCKVLVAAYNSTYRKLAIQWLRSGLELGMLSVYFNINDDGHNAVKEWLQAKDK